jgi:polyferredoxin
MRQKIRNLILLVSLLLFPITMNYLSPYVCIDGAMKGIISGSIIVFIILFFSGIFFGRAWCSWLCPMGGLSEACLKVNSKNVNLKRTRLVRYIVFAIWLSVLIAMFILAGGIKQINPLHLTDTGISVDEPLRYIVYYGVILIVLIPTIIIGKRGACQSFCWMAPFITAGYHVGRILKIPQLRIKAKPSECTNCGLCSCIFNYFY